MDFYFSQTRPSKEIVLRIQVSAQTFGSTRYGRWSPPQSDVVSHARQNSGKGSRQNVKPSALIPISLDNTEATQFPAGFCYRGREKALGNGRQLRESAVDSRLANVGRVQHRSAAAHQPNLRELLFFRRRG